MKGSEVGKEIQLDYRIRNFWPENEVENVLVVFDSVVVKIKQLHVI